ncbi:MAG TPA: NAD(P)-dependent oxidoreductase [Abditibacteriaceae bacterium]
MKILLTGTAGLIGSAVARELLAAGHEVRALDKMPPRDDLRSMNIEMVYADITDRLSVLRAAEGCQAIAHLAAIPNPMHGADRLTEVNVCGTQYILEAAEANAVERVVLASSASIYGMPFARHAFEPDYLPMDEDHPCRPQDVYALSKLCNEEAAATYTRRAGITTVCLRPPMVLEIGGHRARWQRRMLRGAGDYKSNDMWTYLDVRDAARAFRLGLEVPLEGHHRLLLAARDSWTREDIRVLVRRHYPNLASFVEHLNAEASLYNTQKAEEVLGFVPQYSWRDVAELNDESDV